MTDEDVATICRWVARGAKIMIGHDQFGSPKVKVVRGPFGLLTKRFNCTPDQLDRLRLALSAAKQARA